MCAIVLFYRYDAVVYFIPAHLHPVSKPHVVTIRVVPGFDYMSGGQRTYDARA